MSLYTLFQAVFAAGVLVLLGKAIRDIAFRAAAVEPRPYLNAARAAMKKPERLSKVAELGAGTWLGRLARAAVHAQQEDGGDLTGDMGEVLTDIRLEAGSTLRRIRIMGRLGSATGLLGACYQMLWLLFGNHGLDGLIAGRAEQIATDNAILAIAIGFAIAATAWLTRAQLAKLIKEHLHRARDLAITLDDTLGAMSSE